MSRRGGFGREASGLRPAHRPTRHHRDRAPNPHLRPLPVRRPPPPRPVCAGFVGFDLRFLQKCDTPCHVCTAKSIALATAVHAARYQRARAARDAAPNGATMPTMKFKCLNGQTRDAVSLAQADRDWARCSRCGARVKQRVHRPRREGDPWEATIAAHFEGESTH